MKFFYFLLLTICKFKDTQGSMKVLSEIHLGKSWVKGNYVVHEAFIETSFRCTRDNCGTMC